MEIGWKRVMDIVKILARKVCTQIFFSFLITKVLINSFKTNKKHHPQNIEYGPTLRIFQKQSNNNIKQTIYM